MAICEDAKINNNQTELISGDRLVIFTDGLSEALNSKESEFGESRIVQSLCQHQAADPNEFLKLLFSDVDAFVQEAEQADDMTAIALMRL